MKYSKGCLIVLILYITSLGIVYFGFKYYVVNNLESLNTNVKLNWNLYTQNLKERNTELSQQNFKNDSLKYYWNKAKSIATTKSSEELEFNEYKINQFAMSDSLISNWNEKINASLDRYNQSVKAFNQYSNSFPYAIIAKKSEFYEDFKYFDFRYGIDNEKAMIKKKKVENWIKNGGQYPK